MNASIVDLRYKTKAILKALEKNEKIQILYHGKVKGTILPPGRKTAGKVSSHAFFGLRKGKPPFPEQAMDQLRGGRFRDI
jgi:hypothetical protein